MPKMFKDFGLVAFICQPDSLETSAKGSQLRKGLDKTDLCA